MTIAVSVMVSPSRLLNFAVRGMTLLAAGAIVLVLFVNVNLNAIFRFQILMAASILVWSAIFRLRRPGKTFHIDISGIGQIRLTQYSGVSTPYKNTGMPLDGSSGQLVHLSPDSILWPHLILLRLKAAQGGIFSIPILNDSLDESDFAQLLVACRWLAAQPASHQIND
ncbi:MAG: protein YgfX [Burkholderiaceae bacterium]